MMRTLQEARDKFDELFDITYEKFLLEFINNNTINSNKLTISYNGDLVYNHYRRLYNFVDLYWACKELFEYDKSFNDLFYEFQKSIIGFSKRELNILFLREITSSYTNKNTTRLLSVSSSVSSCEPGTGNGRKYINYYIAYQIRIDGKWKNRVIHRIYTKLDILRNLYENTNSSRV